MQTNESNIIIYNTPDGKASVALYTRDGKVWLNQKQIAELFGTSVPSISMHIAKILKEGELDTNSVIKNYLTTASDGKQYDVVFYPLEMILALGYRVQSEVAVRFRRWATQRLHEYIQKGFTMDDERLKQGGNRYFRELLQRIRDIRSSERNFYQQVTDILATELLLHEINSSDYQLLLEGLAKWQLLKETTYEQKHPETVTSTLHNTVFRKTIDGSKVNLFYIREVIGRMLPKITRKNHWFCVWCVQKHRNLLATMEQEAFALQMQHPD